jgi:hypothetical protein
MRTARGGAKASPFFYRGGFGKICTPARNLMKSADERLFIGFR